MPDLVRRQLAPGRPEWDVGNDAPVCRGRTVDRPPLPIRSVLERRNGSVHTVTDLHDVDAWRAHLRRGLVEAMRARNAAATRVLRAALAAVDNAEAPDAGTLPSVDTSAVGGGPVGAGDVAPLRLTVSDVESIVLLEIASRRSAANDYERLHKYDQARMLRDEADVLAGYLPSR